VAKTRREREREGTRRDGGGAYKMGGRGRPGEGSERARVTDTEKRWRRAGQLGASASAAS
jgi:hypothetical protein